MWDAPTWPKAWARMRFLSVSESSPTPIAQYEEIESLGLQPLKFDKGAGTKNACLVGLVLSTICGLLCMGLSFLALDTEAPLYLDKFGIELVPLALNLPILLTTEVSGYIHSVSLRWTLFHEGRLDFNTNLRLLTFSKTSWANGLTCNAIFFMSTALCFASSSMIFVRSSQLDGGSKHTVFVSRSVIVCLGSVILLQCLLSLWCIWASSILTWSSDPFNTLAACMSERLVHQNGRCMRPVHHLTASSQPEKPRSMQKSMFKVDKRIIRILSGAVFCLISFGTATALLKPHVYLDNTFKYTWSFIPTAVHDGTLKTSAQLQTPTVFWYWGACRGGCSFEEPFLVVVLLFNATVQSVLTMGLHCAELLVSLARDEKTWRAIASDKGSIPNSLYNSSTQPLKTWQSVGLLLFKAIAHWIFGFAIKFDLDFGTLFHIPQLFYLTIFWAVFISFMLEVSLHKPKGPLPATYGHLRTMANIIDEWHPKMYWGDKTDGDQPLGMIRHAGTSSHPLPKVDMDALYE